VLNNGQELCNNQTEKCAQLAKVRGVNSEISVDSCILTHNESNNFELENRSIELDNANESFCKALEQTIIAQVNDVCAKSMLDLMVSKNDTNELLTHIITVRPDVVPIKQKTRGVPYGFRESFRKTLMEMKEAGMIVDSKSPWSSPVRLVKKPDGSIRITIDYRKLNNVTVKDSYPLPKIEDIFVHLSKAKIFSTLDLCSGYNQNSSL